MKTLYKKDDILIRGMHDGVQPVLLVDWGKDRVRFGGTVSGLIKLENALHAAIMEAMILEDEL